MRKLASVKRSSQWGTMWFPVLEVRSGCAGWHGPRQVSVGSDLRPRSGSGGGVVAKRGFGENVSLLEVLFFNPVSRISGFRE